MGKNIVQKILEAHDVSDRKIESYQPGDPMRISIDQTITQDATGTMAWLEFEAIGLPRVKVPLAVSYIDHNTLQTDFRNADDHEFLRTIASSKGAILSRPGNGILHQLHLENFAAPGKTMLGSDSHTPTAGGIGSFAMGVGGLAIATTMAGMAYELKMPKVVRVSLTGELRKPWVMAMDIILELLRRNDVKGGLGRIFEFGGPALKHLTVPERATITNMGAELGATTSIFPSDEITAKFMKAQSREDEWSELAPDADAEYDEIINIDLSELEPLVACPHSPGAVLSIRDIVERNVDLDKPQRGAIVDALNRLYERDLQINQVCIGSCTNASYVSLKAASSVLTGQQIDPAVSLCVSPGSKNVVEQLAREGDIATLFEAGVRMLENTCGPCIGMGQTPGVDQISVRTFNRNFKGRSGEKSAHVYLANPAVAALFAVRGRFVDPLKEMKIKPSIPEEPAMFINKKNMFIFPEDLSTGDAKAVTVKKGPNIADCPINEPLPAMLEGSILLKTGDNITTDDIMMAGAKVLPLRSNIPRMSDFVFNPIDPTFVDRARELNPSEKRRKFFVIGADNYGQGSSREHAAIAPMHLGLSGVVAKSIARIHRDNLVQWGMLPLTFVDPSDYERIAQDDQIVIRGIDKLQPGQTVLSAENLSKGFNFQVAIELSDQEIDQLNQGGLLPWVKRQVT